MYAMPCILRGGEALRQRGEGTMKAGVEGTLLWLIMTKMLKPEDNC